MTTYLDKKISKFYKIRSDVFRRVLERIINIMLDKCRYINGESLERHNWGTEPIKLKNIPKNIDSPSFEEELLNALDLEHNEKSIVELLWGDIQLGKRIQACIIMWMSVFILKRPVLYIFRNLAIDQKQLQDDIVGTENCNFNVQFIQSLFEEFNSELSSYLEETNNDYWKEYKLPELKDINSNNIIDKLSNKNAMNSSDIICCLMNHCQLEKINAKFNEYICKNDELVNITVLTDEADLMCPSSSNDRSCNNDKRDSSACEILLAKIYKKVRYSLHITGTAHSLLYNVTTRLSDRSDIQIKISKVHKMQRTDDYYGLFNNSIHFSSNAIEPWWENQDTENCNKKCNYNIIEDYNRNIRNIISEILKRPTTKYNSLLISEEKIRVNQQGLVDKIIEDFPELFIIIYNGKCLRLYLPKKYEVEIKRLSRWESTHSTTSKRLCQLGGVYGSSIDTENGKKLANDYCYFEINAKILNIKFVYKLLRILFIESDEIITYKTIVTITGKYGERGYSFTSDDYDNYSLHLTDQYFVSHASLNCTDISQRLRLQGKYNDLELKNKSNKLVLHTTHEVQDIIENFYVKFIKEIEKFIMNCNSWEEIKELLESILDNGSFKFGKYMKYIDVSKKRKNLKLVKHFDKKNKGYKITLYDDMDDNKLSELCENLNLPRYICINEITKIGINEFINKYGGYESGVPLCIDKNKIDEFDREKIVIELCRLFPTLNNLKLDRIVRIEKGDPNRDRYDGIQSAIENKKPYNYYITKPKPNTYNILIYDNYDNIHITITTENRCLPTLTNDYIKKNPYFIYDGMVNYSSLKDEFTQVDNHGYKNDDGGNFIDNGTKIPNKYYFKNPDGWLYLHDDDINGIYSLDILSPLQSENTIQSENTDNVSLFVIECCKKTTQSNLRFGINDIYTIYKQWCGKKDEEILALKLFKIRLKEMNFIEEKSKGVDINKRPGKRGYNIMLSL